MNHEFIPYGRQTISEEDIAAVEAVLRAPFLTQGPAVPAFEEEIAKRTMAKEAVAVNSATSALHIACKSMGLGEGDILWTSPITFVASANCGLYCGAKVDFVDINPNTGLMCPNELGRRLKEADHKGHLPKIIVPVHLAGTSCEMQEIGELAAKYDIKVIEDASHAIGGSYNGKKIGSCEYSDAAVFSFHPVKIITTGEGGAVCCNDTEMAEKMRMLRSHGITKNAKDFKEKDPDPWTYEQQMLGFNYRMNDIQAALGISQIKRLEEIVKERNELHKTYCEMLKSMPLTLLEIPEKCHSALHLGIIRLLNSTRENHRRVFEGLRSANIGVQLHYSPVHLQPYYKKLGYKLGDFKESEQYATSAISIPLFPGMSYEDQKRVANTLRSLT